ncbi:hypothetical protein Q31b_41480 [Novipirellula aureliae]|uniref:Secreted protein n=1 Tax=Novipirellula aureliae TaxID=2527966 RepID=A0A5C6DVF9_9BACT|nr:hypothetical protein [Novipirellula aureliae]TWU39066.1 hypothetical protein Q31b_41480 [Novipirellula aureliae]
MIRFSLRTNLLALTLLVVPFVSNASAQLFHFGGFGGGVRIRAPFVAVDVDPWGGARVRAPFTAVDSGFGHPPLGPPIGRSPFWSPFPPPVPHADYRSYRFESYRYAPYGQSLGDYSLPDYDPRYDRYDYDHYAHADDPRLDAPAYRGQIGADSYYQPSLSDDPPYYDQQAEDEFIERLYPNQSRQDNVISSAIPQPSPHRSRLDDQLLQAQAESLAEQRIYAAENLSATISDTTLARSAAQLADGLAAMGEEGSAWLDYLAPDDIVRWVDAGSPNNDLLVNLISAYDGVVSNPQLGWVASMAGFRETRHQLHLRIRFIESPGGTPLVDEPQYLEPQYLEDSGSSILSAPDLGSPEQAATAEQQADEPASEETAKPNVDSKDANSDFETLPPPSPKPDSDEPFGI